MILRVIFAIIEKVLTLNSLKKNLNRLDSIITDQRMS